MWFDEIKNMFQKRLGTMNIAKSEKKIKNPSNI